ncbi:hypothetical protein EMCRGX_G015630 [Ephydatia muelleri]
MFGDERFKRYGCSEPGYYFRKGMVVQQDFEKGESLRRLTSKRLCAIVKGKAAEFFEPHQFGVACSNGAEKIARGLRACVNNLHSKQGVQQGDLLGPLLFSLVLNKVVSQITANSVCADLSYHAWYLDDGVLAGPRPAVLQALSIIQEIGPPNGLIVNFHKCEIFSKHDAFCSTFISEKHEEAKALLLKLEEVRAVDLHVTFSLLRQRAGFSLEAFDHNIRATFSKCTVVDTSNQAWKQAELSLSRGGLGIRSLSWHSPAAYISSLSSSGAVPLSQEHLIHAVELFNSLVPSSEAVSMEEVLTSRIHQKVLSHKIDNYLFNILYEQSSAADRARLLSVSSPHAASWVSVIPSEGLGLHLLPSEFQVAIKWWLGLDTSCGSICPLCPGRLLDPLGHHALTCKGGEGVVTRHNKLCDTLAETCRRAHLSVKVEQEVTSPKTTATLALQTS